MNRDLTTGEASKIAGMCPKTVAKWCDTGLLKHYKLPNSRDRRINKQDLLDFLKLHGVPTNET